MVQMEIKIAVWVWTNRDIEFDVIEQPQNYKSHTYTRSQLNFEACMKKRMYRKFVKWKLLLSLKSQLAHTKKHIQNISRIQSAQAFI